MKRKRKSTERKSKEDLRISRESFHARKTLFAIFAFSQIANLVLLALLSADLSLKYISTIIFMCVLAIFILCDSRKNHIDWIYVIIASVLYFFITAFYVFQAHMYLCFWLIVPEFVAFLIATPILYRSYSTKKSR